MIRRIANIIVMTVLLLGPALLLRYVDSTDALTEWSSEATSSTTEASVYTSPTTPH